MGAAWLSAGLAPNKLPALLSPNVDPAPLPNIAEPVPKGAGVLLLCVLLVLVDAGTPKDGVEPRPAPKGAGVAFVREPKGVVDLLSGVEPKLGATFLVSG